MRQATAKYRDSLPQLGGGLFLTDGGIETTLIFHEGWELPDFAAFHLLRTPEGEAALRNYFQRKSHAELNDSAELDTGDPVELGKQYAALRGRLPHLNVLGGCCGTDHRHVERIAEACS